MRRFKRVQVLPDMCARCPDTRRTPSFRFLQLISPLPQAILDLSGHGLDLLDSFDNPLCLAPPSRRLTPSLLRDPLCPPPPPLPLFVLLHSPLNSVQHDIY